MNDNHPLRKHQLVCKQKITEFFQNEFNSKIAIGKNI
jgi:hypothetical protein